MKGTVSTRSPPIPPLDSHRLRGKINVFGQQLSPCAGQLRRDKVYPAVTHPRRLGQGLGTHTLLAQQRMTGLSLVEMIREQVLLGVTSDPRIEIVPAVSGSVAARGSQKSRLVGC